MGKESFPYARSTYVKYPAFVQAVHKHTHTHSCTYTAMDQSAYALMLQTQQYRVYKKKDTF